MSGGVVSKRLCSTLDADGQLTVELVEQTLPPPTGRDVLIRVEAAPINPSDLGLLFASADVKGGQYTEGRIVATMPDSSRRNMGARVGKPLPVGNEGAGAVVAAGDAPEARALLGKRVTCMAGGMFTEYRVVDARLCMALPDTVTAEQGAAAFVNPMTALAFVEHMRLEGHSALVHTAAASNLGQMLVKICQADGIPLVNIVRSPAQAGLLAALGAEHVIDSSQPDFPARLGAAVGASGATLAFDAIGGGRLVGQILDAMEKHGQPDGDYSRYGSSRHKQAYIYGTLDMSPTVIERSFGFAWGVSGWLLTPFLARIGEAGTERIRQRIRAELTTTFASSYKARVTLEQALTREAVLDYNARRTGEKYLIVPNGAAA